MFSYEAMKTFHIIAAFVLVSFGVANLLLPAKSKVISLLFLIGSMTAAIAGTGLIGVMGQGVPMWVLAKYGVWIAFMAVAGIAAKRFPGMGLLSSGILIALAAVAVFLAVFKPF
jgi:hypothetical protein